MTANTPSFITAIQHEALLANGRQTAANADLDPYPVVKLFTPDAAATWLLTELDPDEPDIAFGLCDLGLGCPELGRVSLVEIASVQGRLGLPIEQDHYFVADRALSAYTRDAIAAGRITA